MDSSTQDSGAISTWRDDLLVQLVPHAVHRLGNQLTVVLGTADLLALLDEDPERRQQLGSVAQSAREATDLIRALGLHARATSEPARAHDLAHFVGAVEPLLGPVAKAGGFELLPVEARGVSLVHGDGTLLQLLVLGLLVSQAAPGPDGRRADGRLRVRAVELGRRVALLVTTTDDSGGGLPLAEPDARALDLAARVGGRVRVRLHPSGRARTLLLGLPILDADLSV